MEPYYTSGLVETADELTDCYSIRIIVFVEEQAVPVEEEMDAYDLTATHFLVKQSESAEVVATARFLDKGDGVGKIGRVAVLIEYRGKGIGALIMSRVEQYAVEHGFSELILEAQMSAIVFYEKLGYVAEGEVYLDCNIEHRLKMKSLA